MYNFSMGRKHIDKLTGDLERESLRNLWNEIQKIKSPDGAAKFLDDFLTTEEKKLVLRRLTIIHLVKQGKKYKEISKLLKVSKITISRTKDILAGRGYGRNPGRKRRYGSSYSIIKKKRKEKKLFRKYKGAESII